MRPSIQRPISSTLFICLFIGLASCSEKQKPAEKPSALTSETLGVVVEVEGNVTYGGKAVVQGQKITLGDVLATENGNVTVEIEGLGQLTLFPGSRVKLNNKKTVRLILGKIWAAISLRDQSSFEVQTGNAVAGVRGTEFVVTVENEQTTVAVVEGIVAVHNQRSKAPPRLVKARQQVKVIAEKDPEEPTSFEITREELKKQVKAIGGQEAPAVEPPEVEALDPKGDGVDSEKDKKRGQGAYKSSKEMKKLEKQGKKQLDKLKREDKKTQEKLMNDESKERIRNKDKKKDIQKKMMDGKDVDVKDLF